MNERAKEQTHTHAPRLGRRTRLRTFVLVALTIAGIYVCYRLTVPFLPALTWALALAILFVSPYRWFEARVDNSNLAAAVSVLLIALIVVVPVALLASQLITEAGAGISALQDKVASGEWRRAIESHETLAPLAQWLAQIDFQGAIQNVAAWVTATSASFLSGSVGGLISLVLTFYLLFYFLRDRKAALDWVREISPLSRAEMDQLFGRIIDIVQATLYGTVVVAAVQGALGGLIFWWLDLPTPLFWGIVMGLLAVIPVLGAFVVWVPTAVFLALNGSWDKALILTLWGAVVVGGIDNLLYPMLVGNRLKIHTVPAFISIVGGLILFGSSGLLLGPLAVTVTIFLFEIWRVPIGGHEG